MGIAVEKLHAVFRDQHQIFQPHTGVTAEVDARFNGENHAGLYRPVKTGGDITVFMFAQPDEVPEPVVELRALSLCSDQIARCRVKLTQFDTRTDQRLRRFIGTSDNIIDVPAVF